MVNIIIYIGFIVNFLLFIHSVVILKGFVYIPKENCNLTIDDDKYYTFDEESKGWQKVKLPIIGWIVLILMNLCVPYLGGVLSEFILDCYREDYQNDNFYYCTIPKKYDYISKKFERFTNILMKPIDWLMYKA